MRRGSGINKGTDPEQSAKQVEKDVHNMKAVSDLAAS